MLPMSQLVAYDLISWSDEDIRCSQRSSKGIEALEFSR
jgi:hypothetical protein